MNDLNQFHADLPDEDYYQIDDRDELIPLLRNLFSELPHPALLEAADRLERLEREHDIFRHERDEARREAERWRENWEYDQSWDDSQPFDLPWEK